MDLVGGEGFAVDASRAAGAVMQTGYAGQTVPVVDPVSGVIFPGADFCRVARRFQSDPRLCQLQKLPDWIDGRPLGTPK
jgi:hypothetical protein